MASTIKLRRSATSGAIPTTSQLALGELAMNTFDGKLFLKTDQSGTEAIVEVGSSSGGSITISSALPSNPDVGDVYWDSDEGNPYIYYDDGNTQQWVALVSTAPALDASGIVSGTLSVDRGGTGQTTYTDGQLLIGNSSDNSLAKATLTAGSGVTITNGNGTIEISSPPQDSGVSLGLAIALG